MEDPKQEPKTPEPEVCKTCAGPMTHGMFYSKCPKCDSFYFEKCRICGAQRIFCCC